MFFCGVTPVEVLLGPGFRNQMVNVRLFDAEYLRPLRAIVQKLRPRTLFDVQLHGIAEYFIHAAVFRLRALWISASRGSGSHAIP